VVAGSPGAQDERVPTAAELISWLTAHAVLLLAASGTLTVAGELGLGTVRRRVVARGSATSLTAALAYFVV
jgi:hypothetical protein